MSLPAASRLNVDNSALLVQIVRDWLQRTAPRTQEPELKRGYWRFTKLELMHQLRSNGPRTTASSSRPLINSLVQELDPDAVTRQGQSGQSVVLEPKDAVSSISCSRLLTVFAPCPSTEQDLCYPYIGVRESPVSISVQSCSCRRTGPRNRNVRVRRPALEKCGASWS